jgi:hypothetical protein
MTNPRTPFAILAIGLLLACLGCAGSDPVDKVLKQRARWKVELLSFTVLEDGRSRASFRLSGPVKNELETLTVRLDMVDVNEEVIQTVWHSFDVSDIQRGVPTERSVNLPPTDVPVEGIGMDAVLQPSEDDFRHIPELAGIEH